MYQLVHLLLSRLINHDDSSAMTTFARVTLNHRLSIVRLFTKTQEIAIFCFQDITAIFQPILTSSQSSCNFAI